MQFCQRQANCIAHCCPCWYSLLDVAIVVVCRCRLSSFFLFVHLFRQCWSSSLSVIVVHCFKISDVNSKHQLSFDFFLSPKHCRCLSSLLVFVVVVVGCRPLSLLVAVVYCCFCSSLLLFVALVVFHFQVDCCIVCCILFCCCLLSLLFVVWRHRCLFSLLFAVVVVCRHCCSLS